MKAANIGATKGRGKLVGINVNLSHEPHANLFIDSDKLITFDHFFVRGLMFVKYSHGFYRATRRI